MVYTEDESLCHSFLQCVNMKLKDEWIARKGDKAKFKNIEDKKGIIEFSLKTKNCTDPSHQYETEILAIIHAWYQSDIKCTSTEDYPIYEWVNKDSIERFRRLILFWIVGNDVNMHLYFDFA